MALTFRLYESAEAMIPLAREGFPAHESVRGCCCEKCVGMQGRDRNLRFPVLIICLRKNPLAGSASEEMLGHTRQMTLDGEAQILPLKSKSSSLPAYQRKCFQLV